MATAQGPSSNPATVLSPGSFLTMRISRDGSTPSDISRSALRAKNQCWSIRSISSITSPSCTEGGGEKSHRAANNGVSAHLIGQLVWIYGFMVCQSYAMRLSALRYGGNIALHITCIYNVYTCTLYVCTSVVPSQLTTYLYSRWPGAGLGGRAGGSWHTEKDLAQIY